MSKSRSTLQLVALMLAASGVAALSPHAFAAKKKKGESAPAAAPAAEATAAPAAGGAAPAAAAAPAVTDDILPSDPACGADIKKVCADVEPGGDYVSHCLRKNKAQLSPECRPALNQYIGKRIDESCSGDGEKLCTSEKKQGLMPMVACLQGKGAEALSRPCAQQLGLASMPERRKASAQAAAGEGGGGAAPARKRPENPLAGFFLPPVK